MKEQSRDIIDILADVVAKTSSNCKIKYYDGTDFVEGACPAITYCFGNAQYLKDCLDVNSKTYITTLGKFPLIHLICPVNEQRNISGYHSKAKIRLIIACSTHQEYSNEERLAYSFRNVLRPIYRSFLEALKEDKRLSIAYDETIPHEYSENYSYGRYGALTPSGEEISEPIDAIVISNLELIVNLPNCR